MIEMLWVSESCSSLAMRSRSSPARRSAASSRVRSASSARCSVWPRYACQFWSTRPPPRRQEPAEQQQRPLDGVLAPGTATISTAKYAEEEQGRRPRRLRPVSAARRRMDGGHARGTPPSCPGAAWTTYGEHGRRWSRRAPSRGARRCPASAREPTATSSRSRASGRGRRHGPPRARSRRSARRRAASSRRARRSMSPCTCMSRTLTPARRRVVLREGLRGYSPGSSARGPTRRAGAARTAFRGTTTGAGGGDEHRRHDRNFPLHLARTCRSRPPEWSPTSTPSWPPTSASRTPRPSSSCPLAPAAHRHLGPDAGVPAGRAGVRTGKEVVAAGVSLANRCPFCVHAHTVLLHATGDHRLAETMPAGRRAGRAGPRRLLAWGRGHGYAAAVPLREHAPEYMGTALAFHFINRVVSSLLTEDMLPGGAQKLPAGAEPGGPFAGPHGAPRTARPGDSLALLDTAGAAPRWAADTPVGTAYARAAHGGAAGARACWSDERRRVRTGRRWPAGTASRRLLAWDALPGPGGAAGRAAGAARGARPVPDHRRGRGGVAPAAVHRSLSGPSGRLRRVRRGRPHRAGLSAPNRSRRR